MKAMFTVFVGVLIAAAAYGGDVYVVTDAQGNRVYTDRPQTLPAQRVDVAVSETTAADAARAQQRMGSYSAEQAADAEKQAKTAQAQQARTETAEDQAKRCMEARERYQSSMNAIRLYEEGPDGQRRYLSSEEIDAARANAKQAMDTFCASQ
jgi:hypothetical protein